MLHRVAMRTAAVHLRRGPRRLLSSNPAVGQPQPGAGDIGMIATGGPDDRPWPVKNWKGIAFATFVGAWMWSLWCGNRVRKAIDEAEERLMDRMPANEDERLEMRALNDVAGTSAVSSVLPVR